jgi:hypothetical protein
MTRPKQVSRKFKRPAMDDEAIKAENIPELLKEDIKPEESDVPVAETTSDVTVSKKQRMERMAEHPAGQFTALTRKITRAISRDVRFHSHNVLALQEASNAFLTSLLEKFEADKEVSVS